MKSSRNVVWATCLAVVTAVLLAPSFVKAAEKAPKNAKQVELFAAMKAGDIAVKLIPKNVKEANVLIENKTKQPLTIKLPEAFAGVPASVLAQMGGMMGGMGGGMGGGGMGGMGGMFNVAPEKVGKLKVPTVCLEHGKRDPNPRVAYVLCPIETFTKNQKVIEVCKMLGYRQVPRNTAQASVWHLGNGLSWAELASKDRVRLSNGYTEKYFSPQEIGFAMRVANEATQRAEKSEKADPGKYDSLSQK